MQKTVQVRSLVLFTAFAKSMSKTRFKEIYGKKLKHADKMFDDFKAEVKKQEDEEAAEAKKSSEATK